MGLDMYVYRISRGDFDANKVYEESDSSLPMHTHFLRAAIAEESPEMYADLLPYTVKSKLKMPFYDVEGMAKDSGLDPDSACLGSWGNYGATVCGKSIADGASKSISFEPNVVKEKYVIERIEDVYFWLMETVAHWRNDYELDEKICMALESFREDGTIENNGFYQLNADVIRHLKEKDPEGMASVPVEEPNENASLFYRIWY